MRIVGYTLAGLWALLAGFVLGYITGQAFAHADEAVRCAGERVRPIEDETDQIS